VSKRCLVTFGWGEPGREQLDISLPLFSRYASRYGYDLFVAPETMRVDRHPAWHKILVLPKLLESYDEVLWIDSDIVIMRYDKDIAQDASPAPFNLVVHHTVAGAVPNSGVLYLRKQAKPYLEECWNITYPSSVQIWWEQAALINRLGGNCDARPVYLPPNDLWSELPYEWNPHILDPRGVPEDCRFFHATMFPDRKQVMLDWKNKINF